ncbi:hypothetical protein D3C83_111900 [compost metagenome]
MGEQHRDDIVSNLHETTADLERLVGAAALHVHFAFAEQNEHWGMTFHDAQLSIPCGHDDRIGFAFIDGLLG